LKLLGGLLKAGEGEIRFSAEGDGGSRFDSTLPKIAFMFQEARLLPWRTVLDHIAVPLEKETGKEESRARARRFLSLVSLEEKERSFPGELSGGEARRVSLARAFAWPAPALFMDEPFQSLDIPLKINMMDLCLSLLKREERLLIAVTHDPREAVYMGRRIIVLGRPGEGIVYDKLIDLSPEDRAYGSAAAGEPERELLAVLGKPDVQRRRTPRGFNFNF
jgi:NitT/TauT family transport system ATP-binding protein